MSAVGVTLAIVFLLANLALYKFVKRRKEPQFNQEYRQFRQSLRQMPSPPLQHYDILEENKLPVGDAVEFHDTQPM